MQPGKIVLIVHNVRSALNVGSLLRTADGLSIDEVYMTGYTSYPEVRDDSRLPHIRLRAGKQIRKTALGAERNVKWSHRPDIEQLIKELRLKKFTIAALEQTKNAKKLPGFEHRGDIALIVGNEVDGIDDKVLKLVDFSLEIPMLGAKESFNVAVAAALALYQLRWPNKA